VKRWQHGLGLLLAGQLLALLALLLMPLATSAHESRPAYLAIKETAPGQFSVLWRTPVLAGMRLPIVLKLPDRAKNLKDPVVSELADSLVERRWVDAGPNGLAGERIEFAGLQFYLMRIHANEVETMKNALIFAAVAEAVTGLALLIAPALVGLLLFGQEFTGVAVPAARVTGIALIGLGVACWPGPPLVGMLTIVWP
jgi:hypothetical protein